MQNCRIAESLTTSRPVLRPDLHRDYGGWILATKYKPRDFSRPNEFGRGTQPRYLLAVYIRVPLSSLSLAVQSHPPGNESEWAPGQIIDKLHSRVAAFSPQAKGMIRLELRYQGKGIFCYHAFGDAKAVGIFVCLGDFSFAEPFKRTDGIIG